ncbi:hypothetical protein ABW20_dc0101722 [Dactylellina cionopaga]|nr:hypothetical protein ABW20_dc0101722 [Dactylellina cionopaga]
MAEIVGLVVGGISLATIFSAAIGLCECVHFGRSFGDDYEIALTKLSIVRLRLSRWAAIIQEQDPDLATPEDGQEAFRILERIQYLFEEIQKLSLKYPGEVVMSKSRYNIKNITNIAGNMIRQRQKRTGMFRKTLWAVYDKERLNRMLDDVTILVDGLVNLFPPEGLSFARRQQSRYENDTANKLNGMGVNLLERRPVEGSKHIFIGNEIRGQAKVKFGDEYLNGSKVPMVSGGSLYKDNKIEGGGGCVHYGDTFGGRSFLETTTTVPIPRSLQYNL